MSKLGILNLYQRPDNLGRERGDIKADQPETKAWADNLRRKKAEVGGGGKVNTFKLCERVFCSGRIASTINVRQNTKTDR